MSTASLPTSCAWRQTTVPDPGPGRVRVAVHACGLAPADWALCRGLFPGQLPRGIGCDVSGTVDAVGDGVTDVAVGDRVFGTADWAHCPSAGASDRAIMDHWFAVPDRPRPHPGGGPADGPRHRLPAPDRARPHTRPDDPHQRRRGHHRLRRRADRAQPRDAGDRHRRPRPTPSGCATSAPPSPPTETAWCSGSRRSATARSTSSSTPPRSAARCPTWSRSPAATPSASSRSPISRRPRSSASATPFTRTPPC